MGHAFVIIHIVKTHLIVPKTVCKWFRDKTETHNEGNNNKLNYVCSYFTISCYLINYTLWEGPG